MKGFAANLSDEDMKHIAAFYAGKTAKPGASEAFLQGLPAGPLAMQLGPDGAVYFITHGGATKASTNDTVARIVWKQH
jgi:hypothetical protein